jgi:hypothetical protein
MVIPLDWALEQAMLVWIDVYTEYERHCLELEVFEEFRKFWSLLYFTYLSYFFVQAAKEQKAAAGALSKDEQVSGLITTIDPGLYNY